MFYYIHNHNHIFIQISIACLQNQSKFWSVEISWIIDDSSFLSGQLPWNKCGNVRAREYCREILRRKGVS